MCFSLEASLFFAALSGCTGALLHMRGQPMRRVQLFYYFMTMELLQAGASTPHQLRTVLYHHQLSRCQ